MDRDRERRESGKGGKENVDENNVALYFPSVSTIPGKGGRRKYEGRGSK